jgi:hypothetical protein
MFLISLKNGLKSIENVFYELMELFWKLECDTNVWVVHVVHGCVRCEAIELI